MQSGRCCLFSAIRKKRPLDGLCQPGNGPVIASHCQRQRWFGHQRAPGICQAVARVAHAWILAVSAVPVAAAVVKKPGIRQSLLSGTESAAGSSFNS